MFLSILLDYRGQFFDTCGQSVVHSRFQLLQLLRHILLLRKRLDQFSFKFVNLSETVIRQAAAHSLSILRDLNDLLTLEPSLSDL